MDVVACCPNRESQARQSTYQSQHSINEESAGLIDCDDDFGQQSVLIDDRGCSSKSPWSRRLWMTGKPNRPDGALCIKKTRSHGAPSYTSRHFLSSQVLTRTQHTTSGYEGRFAHLTEGKPPIYTISRSKHMVAFPATYQFDLLRRSDGNCRAPEAGSNF